MNAGDAGGGNTTGAGRARLSETGPPETGPPGQGLPVPGLPGQAGYVTPAGLAAELAVQRMRARLLGGYGPGASEATVTAVTRDRPVVAGQPTVVGLEQQARQAACARGSATTFLRRLLRWTRRILTVAGAALLLGRTLAQSRRRRAGSRG